MEGSEMKQAFFLIVIAAVVCCAIDLSRAENIRIACVIPETVGVNIPLVNETLYTQTREKTRESSAALQKETTETRLIQGVQQACVIQTIYIK